MFTIISLTKQFQSKHGVRIVDLPFSQMTVPMSSDNNKFDVNIYFG